MCLADGQIVVQDCIQALYTYLNISEADEDTILDSPLTPASLSDDVDTELIKDSVIGVCNISSTYVMATLQPSN